MKIVILDGKVLNPGDVDWSPISSIAPTEIYGDTVERDIAVRTADADVVITTTLPLRDGSLKSLGKNVRLICRLGTGCDNFDLVALAKRGVTVCNVIAYGVDDVAQHTIALLLELCRHVSMHTQSVHSGEWQHRNAWCYWLQAPVNLDGLTLGLIGFGAIGRRVGELAHAFGMKVLGNCHTPRNPPTYIPFSFASLDQILEQSDVISLHCPLTDETRHMINKKTIARMKDGVYLLNVARGQLLCEKDVADALRSGKIAGLGSDVLEYEPPRQGEPLLDAPNAIITPHIAWASRQSRQRIISMTGENIRRWVDGTPINVVAAPKNC